MAQENGTRRSRSPVPKESLPEDKEVLEFDKAFMDAFARNSMEMEKALTMSIAEGIKEPIQKTVLEVCKGQFTTIN